MGTPRPFAVISRAGIMRRFPTLAEAEKSARRCVERDGKPRDLYAHNNRVAAVVCDPLGRVWTDVYADSCNLL